MNRESSRSKLRPFNLQMPEYCLLDRLADAELQMGHVAQAERLAARAAELREARR
jgi:hypothetical protein